MIGTLSLLGFLALASPALSSPSSPVDAERLPAFPEPTLVADIIPGPAGSTPRLFRPVRVERSSSPVRSITLPPSWALCGGPTAPRPAPSPSSLQGSSSSAS